MICYLGLGSNLGDRNSYIGKAVTQLITHSDLQLLKCSSIIETKAFGLESQPDFLNCVLKIKTTLEPAELLNHCLKIEENMGRLRTEKWGPRIIDIDILFYGDQSIDQPNLKIPHAGIAEREFLLRSLNELCPDLIHPELKKSIKQLYSEITKKNGGLIMKKVATIILAAGQGTRMKSEKPKVIHDLAGKPMINRVIETALKLDSDPVVVVVGYRHDLVMKTIPQDSKVKFVKQQEQKGTGHAVMVCAKEFSGFAGDVFILCGDVPLLRYQTLQKMLKHHQQKKAACTVLTAVMKDALKYGRIVRNSDGKIQRIVEYKDASAEQKQIREINTGIYCFDTKSLFDALNKVNNSNNQSEYYLTDTLEILNDMNKLVSSIILADMVEASGVNSKEELKNLEAEYLRREIHFSS